MKSSIRLLIAGVLLAALFTPALVQSGSRERNRTVRTTAYTHSESDHLKYGRKTALGTQLKHTTSYTSAAADWSRFPVGTKFKIKGSRTNYVIDDYGSALVGTDTVDIYQPSRSAMNRWGVRHVDIEITEFGDYTRSREILSQRTKYRHCRTMLAAIPQSAPDNGKRGWFWNRKPKDNTPAADPAPAPAATPKVEAPVMLASNDSGSDKQFGILHWFRGRNSDSENSAPATLPAAEPQRREVAPVETTPDVMLASSDNADSPKRTWFWNRKKAETTPASVQPQPVEAPIALASTEPAPRHWFGNRNSSDTPAEAEPQRAPVVLASNTAPARISTPVSALRSHAQATPAHAPAPTTPAPAPRPEPASIVIADNTPATQAAMPQIRKVQLTAPAPTALMITNESAGGEPVATARRPGSSSSTARPVFAIARPDSPIPHRKREVRALPAGWKP